MARTPEQITADDALTLAIEECLRVYSDDTDPSVLMEYVVVTSQRTFDDEGDALTAVGSLFRDSDVPLHRVLGLLDYAATRVRTRIASDD